MFRHFCQLLSKEQQKLAHLVRKHEKSLIWQKEASFQANYHVFAFWSTFQPKVAKSGSFRKKWRTIVDLAKTSHFSSKLPRFAVLVNFSAQSSKSGSFRQKAPKIINMAKFRNSWSILSWLGVLVKFWPKSCKKWLISLKSTRNLGFSQP